MMKRFIPGWPMMCCAALLAAGSTLLAQETAQAPKADAEQAAVKENAVYPVAVFPFQERGKEVEGLGAKTTDLLFANLVANPNMYLVEREDVTKLLGEQELNLSGLINPEQASRVGELTGAKVIVTGSVLQVGDKLYVIAKIIGTESSRVLGASVKGKVDDDLDALVEGLAGGISETVAGRSGDLIPAPADRQDRLAALKEKLKDGERPVLFIDISERHIGQAVADPAAATELARFAREAGFDVIDANEGNRNQADVLLLGEGFSQFASRHGNLTSVKARVELKAVDRKSGRILAVDRQVSIGAGLAEQVAAKETLQDAAAAIASRLLPRLVEPKPAANEKAATRE